MLSKLQYLGGSIFSLFLMCGFAQGAGITCDKGISEVQASNITPVLDPSVQPYADFGLDTVPANDSSNFTRVEVEARYPGGDVAWRSFVGANLNPDVPVKKKAPVGRYEVIIQFVVGKDGNVEDIEALTSHGYGMEEEVIRVIKKSKKWSPAIQNGKPVRAYRKQPIHFDVIDERKKKKQ